MNRIADPFAEVSITEFAYFLTIFFNHKLLQVVKVKRSARTCLTWVFCGTSVLVSEISEDVLYSNVAIVVSVQTKECLSHWVPIIGELYLQSFFENAQSLLNYLWLLILILHNLLFLISIPSILIGLLEIIIDQIEMREESFLESVKIHPRAALFEHPRKFNEFFQIVLSVTSFWTCHWIQKIFLDNIADSSKVHRWISFVSRTIQVSENLPQFYSDCPCQMVLAKSSAEGNSLAILLYTFMISVTVISLQRRLWSGPFV